MGPLNWYFDTSVLVPAAVTHHPHNAPSLAVLEELVRRKHRGYLSAHSLTEVYSVLTRTPFKPPLYPSESAYGTGDSHGGRVSGSRSLLCRQWLGRRQGRVYTFNVKDFRALAPSDLADKIAAP
jgi:hypothetical protein